jgi:hypothetical protein
MKSSVRDCLAQDGQDENSSPLLRLGGSISERIYPVIQDFLAAKHSAKQFTRELLSAGVSQDAVFRDDFQLL